MRIRYVVPIILGITFGSIGSTTADQTLVFRTGLGYEYLSQEFYLDDEAAIGTDSLELTTQLKTTYLDDFKGQVSLSYRPYGDYRLEVQGVAEHTEEQLRLRLTADYRGEVGSVKLRWSSELERRDDRTGAGEADYGYLSGYARAKATVPVASRFSLFGGVRGDFVSFDSVTSDLLDHFRVSGQLGTVQSFGDFSSLTLGLFAGAREVDRSTDQDYRNFGLEGSFLGLYSAGQLDALIRFESRDYDQQADLGDYRRGELVANNRHSLSDLIFAREELEIETIHYDTTDLLPQNYKRAEVTLMAGLAREVWSAAAGLEVETLAEESSSGYSVGEAYTELGLKTQLDIMLPGRLFASLESVTGRRDLSAEGSDGITLSDFTYERVQLIADVVLGYRFNLSLMAAADWEWHDRASENSRMGLISTSLTRQF